MRVRIRRATPDDGPGLVAVDTATWSPAVTPAPRWDAERDFFARTRPENVLVAVVEEAVVEGEVAGYAVVDAASALPSHAHVLQVHGLAVHPRRQGRGVGRRLVTAAVEEARRRGARRLTLRVLGSNPAARALYERCGFVVEGALPGEYLLDGRFVDDILMGYTFEPAGPAGPAAAAGAAGPGEGQV